MERRRFLRAAAAGMGAVSTGAATTGCGIGGTGETTLRLVAADYGSPSAGDSSRGYWHRLTDAFQRAHSDIRIDVRVLSWNTIEKKVAEMVADDEAPDMAQIGAYADFAGAGKLYKVSDLLPIPVQADFLANLAEAGQVNRVQYGLPFVTSTRLFFYNKALFDKAGLDPDKPPRTWSQVRSMAERLNSAGVKIPYGLPLGPEEAQGEALMWMLGADGGYTDSVGTYSINADENVRALRWLRENLVRPGLTQPAPHKTNRAEIFEAFAEGEVGMLNGHPTLMPQAKRGKVDFGMAQLPGEKGPAGSTLGVADWMMAFRQHGNREAIGTFLDFVYSEKNHYSFVDSYDLLPVTTSASERMRKDRDHRDLWRFLDQLPSADFYPLGKVSWAAVNADLKGNIGKAMLDATDPEALLTRMQRKAEAEEGQE